MALVNISPLCQGIHLLTDRQRKNFAIYTWQQVGNGFRPVASGLTGSHAVASQILRQQFDAPDAYAVTLTFSGTDAETLSRITQLAYSRLAAGQQAAPPDAHIAFLIGLTSSDLASWDSAQSMLMQPLSKGGKLLSNPLVIEPVTRGLLRIDGLDLETACSLSAEPI